MRAREFIKESKNNGVEDAVSKALPATYAITQLKNENPYLQYRFGVAIAGAKGAEKRSHDKVPEYSKESAWGENQIVISFDPNVGQYIDDALKQMGMHGKRLLSTIKSEESDDVSTKSPITGFKGYPK